VTVRIPEPRAIAHRPSLAVLAAALVMSSCAAPGTQVSQILSASEVPTPSASTTPTTSEPSKTVEPTSGWTTGARFGAGGGWDFARTVVRGGDRFLALGARLEPALEVGYNFGPEHLWTSTDGRSWDEVPRGPELEGVSFQGLVAGPSGGFIAFGWQAPPGSGGPSNGLWQSPDGRTWHEVNTDFDPDLDIKVVGGARGYLLLLQGLGSEPSLWLSTDGLSWEMVHSLADASHVVGVDGIGAGEEGFVALGVRTALDSRSERFALASADGRDWVEAPQPFGVEDPTYRPQPVIAASGPDWIAATAQRDDSAQIWFSANGLDWTPAAVIRGVRTTQAWAPVLVGAGGRLFFSPAGVFPSSIGAPGVWSSTDGRQWAPLHLGGDAVVGGVASGPAGLVLAGASFAAKNESTATFWLGP
jgi:hypothetical protein